VKLLQKQAGDGAVLLAITEPNAAMLNELLTDTDSEKAACLLGYAALVISHDTRPRNWGVIERGRRNLWGGLSPLSKDIKNADFEFQELPRLFGKALKTAYDQLGESEPKAVITFLDAMENWVRRTPAASVHFVLKANQERLAVLLKDRSQKLSGRSEVAKQVNCRYILSISLTRLKDAILMECCSEPTLCSDSGAVISLRFRQFTRFWLVIIHEIYCEQVY
jgi:hypothetical protein